MAVLGVGRQLLHVIASEEQRWHGVVQKGRTNTELLLTATLESLNLYSIAKVYELLEKKGRTRLLILTTKDVNFSPALLIVIVLLTIEHDGTEEEHEEFVLTVKDEGKTIYSCVNVVRKLFCRVLGVVTVSVRLEFSYRAIWSLLLITISIEECK